MEAKVLKKKALGCTDELSDGVVVVVVVVVVVDDSAKTYSALSSIHCINAATLNEKKLCLVQVKGSMAQKFTFI